MMFLTEFVGVTVVLPRCTEFANTVEAFKNLIGMVLILNGVSDNPFAFDNFLMLVGQTDTDTAWSVALLAFYVLSRQFDTPCAFFSADCFAILLHS